MQLLEITNIGNSLDENNLNKIINMDPMEKLDLYYILPNYSKLKDSRDYILEKSGVVSTDNIISIDDLVNKFKETNTYYLEREVIVFVMENILKENDLNINLALEISGYILDLKSQNISWEEYFKSTEEIEELKEIRLIFREYEKYLKENDLKDYIDMYRDSGKALEKISDNRFIFNGFIEFRPEEWFVIEAMSKNNHVIIQYPFASERENLKLEKTKVRAKKLAFAIEEKIEIDSVFSNIAYKYLLSPTKEKIKLGIISQSNSYNELKSVISSIKNDLTYLKPEDISIIIPEEYEELIKIVGEEENINLSSLNEKAGKKLPFIRALLNFFEYIKTDSKQSLISFLENSYINNYEVKIETIEEIRQLDYRGPNIYYPNISTDLKDLLEYINKLIGLVKKDPIENTRKYIESLKLEEKFLAYVNMEEDKNIFIDYIKSLDIIYKSLDMVEDLSKHIDLAGEDQFKLLVDLIENSSYYEKSSLEGIKVLHNINAVASKSKKRYICGLNLDYPKRKRQSYFYSQAFKGLYEKLSFQVESSKEYMDNEIIKFSQSLSNVDELVFSYTKGQGGYSPFLKALEDYVEFEEINVQSGKYSRIIDDLLERKKEINYISKDQVNNLNLLFNSKLSRLKKDPLYWGKLEEKENRVKSYSAKMLDTYNKCGFKFLLDYINELKPVELDYKDTFYIDRGDLYHKVLRDFLSAYPNIIDLSYGEIRDKLEDILEAYKDSLDNWEIAFPIVFQYLYDFLIACQKLLNEMEVRFTPKYFEQRHYTGMGKINIYGDIDRIDESSSGDLLIYDYKSKNSPGIGRVLDLGDLQLPVYLILLGNKGVGGFYGNIEKGEIINSFYLEDIYSKKAKGKMDKDQLQDYKIKIEEKIFNIDSQVDQGAFMVDPINKDICKYCDHKNICRVDEI